MLKKVSYFLLLILNSLSVLSQTLPKTEIKMGPGKISIEELLTIEVVIYGSDYNVEKFPVIKGFTKENTTTAHSEKDIDGQKVEIHTITKAYRPDAPGEIEIPELELNVNGELFRIPPGIIIVEGEEEVEPDFDIEDADLVLDISKRSAFVGEGIRVTLSFYISERNTRNWQFVNDRDLSNQIEQLSKQIKPQNSLENRRIISSIRQREKTVRGTRYLVYDIFEAVYYPLNNDLIKIPALRLKMLVGDDEETFLTSKAQTITVKELPEHPLRDKVSVGVISLSENFENTNKKQTGESFNYVLRVRGQANTNSINFTRQERDKNLDFFENEVQIVQHGGSIVGEKRFSYKILPKIAGEYNMGDYFNLIYFNTRFERYDTLKAQSVFEITGDTLFTQDVIPLDIYDNIESLSTDYRGFSFRSFFKIVANVIWVLMVVFLIIILRKK